MLCRLHNDAYAICAIHFAHPAKDNVAKLLLSAQAIVTRLRQHLRYQINHYVCVICLCATLHIELRAGALVILVLLFEQIAVTCKEYVTI